MPRGCGFREVIMSVEQQTNDLLDVFSKASAGLFEITVRYIKHFEQGLYGCGLAKPSKRMRNALAIDREVLVVVSTFTDQQQRTIKFAMQEIQESQGRLETTMAIVLHRDKDGNSKLRNWGRDAGISILPILEVESLKDSITLERALCVELYSHDTFDVTGPVSDDANFYGRRDEAIDLARKLAERTDSAWKLLDKANLTEKERKIVSLRFGLDGSNEWRTLAEVARHMSCSREYCRQVVQRALRKLRKAGIQNGLVDSII